MNGKVRAELELSKTATEEDARRLAEVLPQVRQGKHTCDLCEGAGYRVLCTWYYGYGMWKGLENANFEVSAHSV